MPKIYERISDDKKTLCCCCVRVISISTLALEQVSYVYPQSKSVSVKYISSRCLILSLCFGFVNTPAVFVVEYIKKNSRSKWKQMVVNRVYLMKLVVSGLTIVVAFYVLIERFGDGGLHGYDL